MVFSTQVERGAVEQGSDSRGSTALSETGGAESGAASALMANLPPDLAMVVQAWPHLDAPTRRQILDLIRTAAQDQGRGSGQGA